MTYGIREERTIYNNGHSPEEAYDRGNFVLLQKKTLPKLFNLSKNCLIVLLYLLSSVNRDSGSKVSKITKEITTHEVWGNLDKWYNEGHLVTARTQKYIAKETDLTQPEVNKTLKKLVSLKYIRPLKSVVISGKRYQIWGLGTVEHVKNKKKETFFYEEPDDF